MPSDVTFATSEDRLLGGRVRLLQPAEGYRAAIDPVLLAAALPVAAGGAVLDLGCGVGAAALCLLARLEGIAVTGLELQPRLAELARRNAALNGAAFTVVEGSLLAPPPLPSFDAVMANPPYLDPRRAQRPPQASKDLANVEGEASLDDWVAAAARHLKPKGRLAMVHRADRLDELLAAMRGRGLGEIRVIPLWPRQGRPASRVVVTARKGVRGALELSPGLVLHRDGGHGYTEEAEAVLRHGQAL